MAIGHSTLRSHTRSKGQSTVAATADQCGLRLPDKRSSKTYDYCRRQRRQEVAEYGLVGAGSASVTELANAMEGGEEELAGQTIPASGGAARTRRCATHRLDEALR